MVSAACAALVAGCSSQYSKIEERPWESVTVTSTQAKLAKDLRLVERPIDRLGRLLDEADSVRRELAGSPSSALLRADYNYVVARIAEIIDDEDLSPWDAPVRCPSAKGPAWLLSAPLRDRRSEYHPSNFEILPVDRYSFKGKLVGVRSVKKGLGAPLMLVGKDLDVAMSDPIAQDRPIHYGLTGIVRFEGRNCELDLIDPLEEETVELDGQLYPLGADFQAPLAMALAELNFEKAEILGLLRPRRLETHGRLARLQQYNPGKIPVLLIHGLGNSPATWVPTIDFLRSNQLIRENYQFWFFSYPSGLPFPVATAALRERLAEFRRHYPDHKDMIVIGHSMGGMIARLLITDSGHDLWDTYFQKPPAKLAFNEVVRKATVDALIFEAEDAIARVIFVGVPHRGSDHATSWIGKLGATAIGDPIRDDELNREMVRIARRGTPIHQHRHLPNSLEVLVPGNPFLTALDALPMRSGVPVHSLIGDRGKGGFLDRTEPVSSDGLVPYWSSQLDGAWSEVVVPSGHWCHLHALGMAEIERILIKHLR